MAVNNAFKAKVHEMAKAHDLRLVRQGMPKPLLAFMPRPFPIYNIFNCLEQTGAG
jgi:hypothetical protein